MKLASRSGPLYDFPDVEPTFFSSIGESMRIGEIERLIEEEILRQSFCISFSNAFLREVPIKVHLAEIEEMYRGLKGKKRNGSVGTYLTVTWREEDRTKDWEFTLSHKDERRLYQLSQTEEIKELSPEIKGSKILLIQMSDLYARGMKDPSYIDNRIRTAEDRTNRLNIPPIQKQIHRNAAIEDTKTEGMRPRGFSILPPRWAIIANGMAQLVANNPNYRFQTTT